MANDHDRFDLFYPKKQVETKDDEPRCGKVKGYDPKSVPLGGRRPIYTDLCRIEVDSNRDCGCAFGQCELGGIL